MNRFAISSYTQLTERIRQQGYVFDVGQISPSVMRQVHMAARDGTLKVSVDSWPIRWLTLSPGVERRTVIEVGPRAGAEPGVN